MAMAVYQLCFLFVFSLTTTLVSSAAIHGDWERVHNDNYTSIIPLQHYNGKSYYMGTHFRATYFRATAFCKHINMELLTIRSEDENTRILKYIREASVGTEYWTSGTRLVDGYSWLWLPYGERIDYTNWSNGQPSSINEKCLQLWVIGKELQWNDRPCDTQFWFICERYHGSNTGGPNFGNSL